MENLISVIVPIYNVENYIHKCIDSIINQTYRNLEIILVDDGSPDNCGKICDEYALKDCRIKVIHKKNGGLSDARNAGIDISTGEYLGFVDSDDYIDTDMYSVLLKNLKDNDADISTCGRIIVTEGNETPSFKNNETVCLSSHDAIKDLFLFNNNVCHAAWDKLYKREMFSEIRFPLGRLFEDAAIMYQVFENARKIVSTKKQMCYYIQRQGSISNCAYNKKKILHQFENKIKALNYYKNKDREKYCFAKIWNLRTVEALWEETYNNDKETADYLLSETRKNFTLNVLKYAGGKQLIKSILFCLNPKLSSVLKKSKIRALKNRVCDPLRRLKQIVFGYFKNKEKYKKYDKDNIFICGIPEHGNRGDQAITIAEVNYISKIFPNRKISLIPENEWYENILCMILITNKYHNLCIYHGGGNMGELYPFQENIRLSAIKHLKKAKFIVFPQSIDYNEKSRTLSKAKKIYESHKNLTIFTREEPSELIRKKIFGNCEGYMVPDIVMSYVPKIDDFERNGILFCVRQDKEKNPQSNSDLETLKQTAGKYEENIRHIDTYSKDSCFKYEHQLDELNKLWSEFKKSEVVITDRLHGMIFSIITKTPCIALDNITGKVGNFYRTWLKKSNVLFISGEEDINKGIEIIKNKDYKKLIDNFELLKNSYCELDKTLNKT